jgi:hypothetical protein
MDSAACDEPLNIGQQRTGWNAECAQKRPTIGLPFFSIKAHLHKGCGCVHALKRQRK